MAKSLGLQAPCVDIALSVVPGAKGQLFGVKFSLSRRCDNPMARRCAIERASAPRVCALSMVCLRAMGLQRRREKDHAPRQIHVFAAGTAAKASCAPGAQEPSEKSIPPFLGQISGTISLKIIPTGSPMTNYGKKTFPKSGKTFWKNSCFSEISSRIWEKKPSKSDQKSDSVENGRL